MDFFEDEFPNETDFPNALGLLLDQQQEVEVVHHFIATEQPPQRAIFCAIYLIFIRHFKLRSDVQQAAYLSSILQLVIEYDATTAQVQDGDTAMLLLHYACELWAPLEILELLVTLNPDALFMPNSYGRIPLHVALTNDAPIDLIFFLLDRLPQGANIRDGGGNLPIHLATSHSLIVCERLVEMYPESVTIRNRGGNLPLHKASLQLSSGNMDIVSFLLTKFPDGIKFKDSSAFSLFILLLSDRKRSTSLCFYSRIIQTVAKFKVLVVSFLFIGQL